MAQKISRKDLKHDELVEAAFDLGEWIQKHRRNLLIGGGAAVAVLVIAGAWLAWSAKSEAAAKEAFAEGLRLYGATDSRTSVAQAPKAADYPGALAAFEKAARSGGSSSVGRVAELYRGATLLRMGRAGEAAPVLEEAARSLDDRRASNSAKALLAQAYEASGSDDRAATVLRELATDKSGYPADLALLDLARLLRKQGKLDEARQALQDLLARYPQSERAVEARALLEGSQPPG
jgi:TolA-binding protein